MSPATLDQASKEDLRDELIKIKQREKRLKEENKEKAQKMIGTGVTIGTAALMGYVLGGKKRDLMTKQEWSTWSVEKQEEEVKKAQQVAGFDLDLIVGVAGLALGLSDAAGEFSPFLLAAGTGGVSSFATRSLYSNAEKAKEEEPTT